MPAKQESAKICFETIRQRKGRVALLIGAGCSKTAGIPLAWEIVEKIREVYRTRLENLAPKKQLDYSAVVAKIMPKEFLELLRPYVKEAKVNLAHLCIAELLKENIVDRVLTTNFDPLLIQACVLAGVSPAIYDCVEIADLERVFREEQPAVYYLHGQTYGLRVSNKRRESKKVRDAIHYNIRERALIVVGYSGTSDGVLEQLKSAQTEFPVFWVPFNKQAADEALKSLSKRKHTFIIHDYDADKFFYELFYALELELPLIARDINKFAEHWEKRIFIPEGMLEGAETAQTRDGGPPAPAASNDSGAIPLGPPPIPAMWKTEQAEEMNAGSRL